MNRYNEHFARFNARTVRKSYLVDPYVAPAPSQDHATSSLKNVFDA